MQNGNNEAVTATIQAIDPHQWVTKHADYLYNYAITRINDDEQARDLVQETFLSALERVERFEGRSSERTWLTSILKNKVIDIYRNKSSGLNNSKEPAENPGEEDDFFNADYHNWKVQYQPQAFGIDEHDPLANKEFNHILQQCMQKLPALWLAVFTMKHMDDQSTDIICTDLKVSSSNFWVIIHRTKLHLRACLQKNWL